MHRAIEPKILYFGTPVVLLSTLNEDGSANIAPMSSAWALGWTVLLGLVACSKTTENLSQTGECVLNLPSETSIDSVERLALLTGSHPVPPYKAARKMRYEPDKFKASGLTPVPSHCVAPPSILECPIQLEAKVQDMRKIAQGDSHLPVDAVAVEVRVVRVKACEALIVNDNYINPNAWHPLIYNFRHYFGLGAEIRPSVSVNFK